MGLFSRKHSDDEAPPTQSDLLSREALAQCSAFPLHNGAWIDETYVGFEKTSPGLTFGIVMHESQLQHAVENAELVAFLKAEGTPSITAEGGLVVGKYYAGDAIPDWAQRADAAVRRGQGGDSVWWPTVDDDQLEQFVAEAVRLLEARLDYLGRWSSFAEWARCEVGVDLTAPTRGSLAPLDYWWLVGETAQSDAVHGLPVYPPEYGLYVPKEDGLIRVYSCMMKSALAEAAYSASTGLAIKSSPIKCLGCFMGGVAQALGAGAVKGALLDERWRIEFATCEEHGKEMPSHYSVADSGEAYDLVGCPEDGTVPVWIRHAWASGPECTATPWA